MDNIFPGGKRSPNEERITCVEETRPTALEMAKEKNAKAKASPANAQVDIAQAFSLFPFWEYRLTR